MKAKIVRASKENVASNRKEEHFTTQYTVFNKDLKEVVICRLYWTANRCYSCVWCPCLDYRSGGGNDIYSSNAIADAINNIGISLSEDISEGGFIELEQALKAIARLDNPRKRYKLHVAHA